MNKSWRSIYVMEENGNQQRKGSVVSHTVSQLAQQARPSQCGAGDKTRQAQDQKLVDRVELEVGNDPPSRSLVVPSSNTGPGVAAGEPYSTRISLSGPADETIMSAVRL